MIKQQTFTLSVRKRETIEERRKRSDSEFTLPVEKRAYTITPSDTNSDGWIGYILTNNANDYIVRGEVQKELLDEDADRILEFEYMNAIQTELGMSGYQLV